MQTLFIWLQYLLPKHLLSRLVGKLAAAETRWLKHLLISRFIHAYDVNMAEAQYPDPQHYRSFNDFFTRALQPNARPLPADAHAVLSPADGAISAIGRIDDDRVFQAKGHSCSLLALLGGDEDSARLFRNGSFVTVYLSPRDYHRVHMPLGGRLLAMRYIPGRLFSVNQTTANNIPELFARNERAVCLFDTDAGPMAVILVGAMIVAGIETVWAGEIAPTSAGLDYHDYCQAQPATILNTGAEMGRFKLGSTAIVMFGPGVLEWQQHLQTGTVVRMGEQLGKLV